MSDRVWMPFCLAVVILVLGVAMMGCAWGIRAEGCELLVIDQELYPESPAAVRIDVEGIKPDALPVVPP